MIIFLVRSTETFIEDAAKELHNIQRDLDNVLAEPVMVEQRFEDGTYLRATYGKTVEKMMEEYNLLQALIRKSGG